MDGVERQTGRWKVLERTVMRLYSDGAAFAVAELCVLGAQTVDVVVDLFHRSDQPTGAAAACEGEGGPWWGRRRLHNWACGGGARSTACLSKAHPRLTNKNTLQESPPPLPAARAAVTSRHRQWTLSRDVQRLDPLTHRPRGSVLRVGGRVACLLPALSCVPRNPGPESAQGTRPGAPDPGRAPGRDHPPCAWPSQGRPLPGRGGRGSEMALPRPAAPPSTLVTPLSPPLGRTHVLGLPHRGRHRAQAHGLFPPSNALGAGPG